MAICFRAFPRLLLFLSYTLAWGDVVNSREADFIFTGASIYLGGSQKYAPSNSALSIRQENIVSINNSSTVLKQKGQKTQTITVDGLNIFPSFSDLFVNFTGLAQNKKNIETIQALAIQYGITSLAGPISMDHLEELKTMAAKNQILIRYELWGDLENPQEFQKWKISNQKNFSAEFVKFGAVFGNLDGTLKNRTAALLEPYNDDVTIKGVPRYTQEKLNELVLTANRLGFSVILKAAGDRSINMAISAFGYAQKILFNSKLRNRIAGLELVDPKVMARFSDLRITIISTPLDLYAKPEESLSSSFFLEKLGPRRFRYLFPWFSLVKEDATLTFGSYSSQEVLNPFLGLSLVIQRPAYASPQENLPLIEAMEAYTSNPAFTLREEHLRGSLREGKYADFVVLNKNPFQTKPQDISKVEVLYTVCHGKIIFNINHSKASP